MCSSWGPPCCPPSDSAATRRAGAAMSAPEHRGSHGGSMLLVVFHRGAPVPAAPATAPLAVKPGGCPALDCACVMSTHKDVVGETSLHLCLAAHMHARRIRPSLSSEMQSSGLGGPQGNRTFCGSWHVFITFWIPIRSRLPLAGLRYVGTSVGAPKESPAPMLTAGPIRRSSHPVPVDRAAASAGAAGW